MIKREMIIGDYHTAAEGQWTLTAWHLEEPPQEQNIVKVPGGSFILDLSTALSDGEPTYGPRNLTATFESSEGDRLARKARIDAMKNRLDGYRFNIELPDDKEHYIVGRVSVKELYNDLSHASVEVTAVCEPWKYASRETERIIPLTETEQTVELFNKGRLALVPTLKVEGGTLSLTFGTVSWSGNAGTYKLPDVFLTPGAHTLKVKGTGKLTITYREAVL